MRVVLCVLMLLLFPMTCFADIERGDRGDVVLELQERLVTLGYVVGELDGVYGDTTENAVKSYQYENKLEMTGKVDKDLYRKMLGKELPDRFSLTGNISLIRRLIGLAVSLQGVPYVFGGTSPGGFDCSGFVQYVFNHSGLGLPRMADEQYYATKRVSHPREGDLVFFSTYTSGVSHVGISLGGNRFIHASSSRGVTVSSLDESYWANCYVGAGSVL